MKNTMKRIMLALLIAALLAGCTPEEKNALRQTADGKANTSPVQEAAAGHEQAYGAKNLSNLSNEICKKLPLSSGLSIGDRFYCLAVVNGNSEFCQMIKGDEGEADVDAENTKNLCLAHASKNSSYCKKMSSNEGKKTCYFVLSQTSGNISFCDGIDYDKTERELCYFSFANALYWEGKSEKITAEDCSKIPANEPDRNTCLSLKERDASACKGNKNCLTFFRQELSFCDDNFKDKSECIRDRALSSKDISTCGLSGSTLMKEDCYGDYAVHITRETATCDKITNSMKRQGCYIDVALKLAER